MGHELNAWIVYHKPIRDISVKAQTLAAKIMSGEAKPYEYHKFDQLAERQQILEGRLAAYERFCTKTRKES